MLPNVEPVGRSPRDRRALFLTAITCLHPCKDEAEWLCRTNEMLDRDGWTVEGEEAKRAAHVAAWRVFWDRSHICVTPSDAAKLRAGRETAVEVVVSRNGYNDIGAEERVVPFETTLRAKGGRVSLPPHSLSCIKL